MLWSRVAYFILCDRNYDVFIQPNGHNILVAATFGADVIFELSLCKLAVRVRSSLLFIERF